MKAIILILSFVVFLSAGQAVRAQEAIYVVRHAEKVDERDDSPLSAEGQRRALALSRLLKDAGITAVYTSEFKRAVDTATPLAEALKQPIRRRGAHALKELVAELKAEHSRERVLVVGHSDTVPELLAAYGVPRLAIAPREYDNLFVLVPQKQGPATFIRLRY